jgi:uncharacterized protein (TIGR00251 family)
MGEAQARLEVQVQPKAGRNTVVRSEEGVWNIRIAAFPVRGKANHELIKYLSGVLEINRSRLSIERGATSKRKVILVTGLTSRQIGEQLEKYLPDDGL